MLVSFCARTSKASSSPFSSSPPTHLYSLPCSSPMKSVVGCCFLAHFQCLIFTVLVSPCIFLQPLCTCPSVPSYTHWLHFCHSHPVTGIFCPCCPHQSHEHTDSSPQCISVCFSILDLSSFRICMFHTLHLSLLLQISPTYSPTSLNM